VRTGARKLFVASLVINALLIGIVLGHLLKVTELSPRSPQNNEPTINVPEGLNQQILINMHAMHLQNRQTLIRIEHEKARAMEILITEPFDEIAYQESIDKIHELRGKAVQNVTDKVKTWVPSLNQVDRAIVADMLRNPPPPNISNN
jgi:uncharacterized membrane protein